MNRIKIFLLRILAAIAKRIKPKEVYSPEKCIGKLAYYNQLNGKKRVVGKVASYSESDGFRITPKRKVNPRSWRNKMILVDFDGKPVIIGQPSRRFP